MKNGRSWTKLTAIAVLGILFFLPASWAESDPGASEHLAAAAILEEKASAQVGLVSYHQRMKDQPSWRRLNPSVTVAREMESHCDAIIEKANALKQELLALADWHRKQVVSE